MQKNQLNKSFLEKIITAFSFVGLVGTVAFSIAYMLGIYIYINGFSFNPNIVDILVYAVLSSITGVAINFLMREQGISFAKLDEENQVVIEEYYKLKYAKSKKKKLRGTGHYRIVNFIKDIFTKGLSLFLSTSGILYFTISAHDDDSLMILGIINLCFFIALGLLTLAKSYNYYYENQIPIYKEQIERYKKGENNANDI